MTKFEDKKRVVVFLDPKDYEFLEKEMWKQKIKFVPQLILKIVDEWIKKGGN